MYNYSLARLFVVLLAALALPASASTIYTYTGNHFTSASPPYTTDMFVSLSFTVPTTIPANAVDYELWYSSQGVATSFTATDGVNLITEAQAFDLVGSAVVTTDASGNITDWAVSFFVDNSNQPGTTDGLFSCSGVTFGFTCAPQDNGWVASGVVGSGAVLSNPGSWTLVPEPGAALLVTAGLLGLATRRRRARVAPLGTSRGVGRCH